MHLRSCKEKVESEKLIKTFNNAMIQLKKDASEKLDRFWAYIRNFFFVKSNFPQTCEDEEKVLSLFTLVIWIYFIFHNCYNNELADLLFVYNTTLPPMKNVSCVRLQEFLLHHSTRYELKTYSIFYMRIKMFSEKWIFSFLSETLGDDR